jgi:hypothetical protein
MATIVTRDTGATAVNRPLTNTELDNNFINLNSDITNKQPLDADLTAIAGLTGTTGLLKKTAADTWSLDTNSYITSGDTGSVTSAMIADGTIVNNDISESAAIAYSKLSLATSIVNGDIKAAAGIVYSKLNLTASIVSADISASAAIAYSKLNLTASIVNADISAAAAIATSKISGLAASATTDTTNAGNISSGILLAARMPALTGDITTTAGAVATTLATVNSNVGTFNNVTVNAKGLVTSASNTTYLTANQSISVTGDISGSGTTAITATLSTVNSNTGSFGSASSIPAITVNAKGLITAVSTNAAITATPRISIVASGASIAINVASFDVVQQVNTAAAGTLSINAPTGSPTDGQKLIYRIQCTNAQTFSWDVIFQGSTDVALPTATTGSSKWDMLGFIYNTTNTKWQLVAKVAGF